MRSPFDHYFFDLIIRFSFCLHTGGTTLLLPIFLASLKGIEFITNLKKDPFDDCSSGESSNASLVIILRVRIRITTEETYEM